MKFPTWFWYVIGLGGAVVVYMYIRANQNNLADIAPNITDELRSVTIPTRGSVIAGSQSPFSTGTPGGGALVSMFLPESKSTYTDMIYARPPASGAGSPFPKAVSVPGSNNRVGVQIVDNLSGYTSWNPVNVGPKY